MKIEFENAAANPLYNGIDMVFLWDDDEPLSDLVFPADYNHGITRINPYAWISCNSLRSITIPEAVTSIGEEAFADCDNLQRITISSPEISVGESAFRDDNNIEDVNVPAGAFNWILSDNLHEVVINSGELSDSTMARLELSAHSLEILDLRNIENTRLDDKIFNEFYKLRQLYLPSGLTYIGYKAVAECIRLDSILIPAGVIEIEDRAFDNCRGLKTVTFAGQDLLRIGASAFYNCHQLANINIPEGVMEIGDAAFYGCAYAQSLHLPSSVQSIGDNGFALCNRMQAMTVDAVEPPEVEDKTFFEIPVSAPVRVPNASIPAYKGHPVWGKLNIVGQIEETPTDIETSSCREDGKVSKRLIDGQIIIIRNNEKYDVTGKKLTTERGVN